jgi:hypothetical protein
MPKLVPNPYYFSAELGFGDSSISPWYPDEYGSQGGRPWSAKDQLKIRLAQYAGTPCEEQFRSAGRTLESLQNAADDLSIYTLPRQGNLSVSSILGQGSNPMTLTQLETLTKMDSPETQGMMLAIPGSQGPGGVAITSSMVLFSTFSGLLPSEQAAILVHELLHYAFQADDAQIVKHFNIQSILYPNNPSIALTQWLMQNCPPNPVP